MLTVVGVGWLVLAGPYLPLAGPRQGVYSAGFATLGLTAAIGVGWEVVYHGFQQLRWDKDWPTIYGLILGTLEGCVVYQFISRDVPWQLNGIEPLPFIWQFGSVWVVIWIVVNGPLRVLFPRWRFLGGEFW